jgi:Ca2+:H+ antiporter
MSATHEETKSGRRFSVMTVLWGFIPFAIVLEVLHVFHVWEAPPFLLFAASAIGVVPCAALMGKATEELAIRSGPGIGGLLNVTFGNAPELIIAFFALLAGLQEVVKASLVGSVLGNTLLVLGASCLVGGITRDRQTFNRTAASTQAAMLLLALAALLFPSLFELLHGGSLPGVGEEADTARPETLSLSIAVSILLIAVYIIGLIFSLKTHRALFNPFEEEEEEAEWTVRKSVTMLAVAGALVGVMSEILVGSISEAAEQVGLSEFFIGVFIVAIVGNAAEHWVAVLVAAKDKMDLAVNIAIGSSAQIALFVAPLLILLSFFFGPMPMAAVFNGYELGALLFAVLIANFVIQDGESTWFEGAQLLSVYAVFGLVFFFA